MKKFKYIHLVTPHKYPPTASLFLVHILRGFLEENSFPKLSIYVGHKFNTV